MTNITLLYQPLTADTLQLSFFAEDLGLGSPYGFEMFFECGKSSYELQSFIDGYLTLDRKSNVLVTTSANVLAYLRLLHKQGLISLSIYYKVNYGRITKVFDYKTVRVDRNGELDNYYDIDDLWTSSLIGLIS